MPISIHAISNPWYSSGNFWTGVGVAIGILAIIVSIVIWRFGTPRAVLEYSMPTVVAILNTEPPGLQMPELEVRVRGKKAGSPYIARLQIVNRGRRDIRSADFDQQSPLVFRLGVPVLELLNRQETAGISVSHQAGEIAIGPMLIRSAQSFDLDILTDGKPQLEYYSPLADTNVHFYSETMSTPSYLLWLARGLIISAAAGLPASTILALAGNTALSLVILFSLLAVVIIASLIAYDAYRRHVFGWNSPLPILPLRSRDNNE